MSDLSVVDPTLKSPVESTPKERELVRRKTKHRPGAGSIIIVKKGEELRKNLQARLDAMKKDLPAIEFHARKLMTDPTYNETREYPENSALELTWRLNEGVMGFLEFKSKMKRIKIFVDHFQPDKDYELTIDEAVEILS